MSDQDNIQVLHWRPESAFWETIAWESWSKFRGITEKSLGLAGINSGVHHFVVCIHDEGRVLNIIPHKYILETDGRIGRDNFGGLTREEREDYRRIMVLMEPTPDDTARLAAIHEKLGRAYYPPEESIEPLKAALGMEPLSGSLADKFLKSYAAWASS